MIRTHIASFLVVLFALTGTQSVFGSQNKNHSYTSCGESCNTIDKKTSTMQIEQILTNLEDTLFNICSSDSKNVIDKRVLVKKSISNATRKIGLLLPSKIDNTREYEDCFFKACRFGDRKLVTLFINAGMDINIADNHYKVNGLMIAVASANTEVVQTLIENLADVLAQDSRGETALEYSSLIPVSLVVADDQAMLANELSSLKYGRTNEADQNYSLGIEQCATLIAQAQKDQGREFPTKK